MRALALLLALTSTGCDALLVGGECLSGYEEKNGGCVALDAPIGGQGGSGGAQGGASSTGGDDVTASSGGSTSSYGAGGKPVFVSTSGGSTCAPLTTCNDVCVDTGSDPNHCGACDVVCTSGLCVSGTCVGAPAGHVALLGFGYADVVKGTQPAHLLGNAVFLSSRNPVRILTVQPATHAGASGQVELLVKDEANARGRTVSFAHASPAFVANHFGARDFDVLLVAGDAFTSPTQARAVADQIHTAWQPYFDDGGVLVVTASVDDTAPLQAFLDETKVFGDVTLGTEIPSAFWVSAWTDALALGLTSPFGPSREVVTLDWPVPSENVPVISSTTGRAIAAHRPLFAD